MSEIQNNHMKSITSAATNPPDIIPLNDNLDPSFINNRFKAEKIEQ